MNVDWGNWWLANLQMESSLEFRGYDYKFVGGEGEHNGEHGGSVLPESLEWLWRQHNELQTAPTNNWKKQKLKSLHSILT